MCELEDDNDEFEGLLGIYLYPSEVWRTSEVLKPYVIMEPGSDRKM